MGKRQTGKFTDKIIREYWIVPKQAKNDIDTRYLGTTASWGRLQHLASLIDSGEITGMTLEDIGVVKTRRLFSHGFFGIAYIYDNWRLTLSRGILADWHYFYLRIGPFQIGWNRPVCS